MPAAFFGLYKMRKSDVNPLGAALPQSFLRRKKNFYCVVFYTQTGFEGSKKTGKSSNIFRPQHRSHIKTMATLISLSVA
jgi:hypothetical protein